MEESCFRIGIIRNLSRNVCVFWHQQDNESISEKCLNTALSELYPAALNVGDIETQDAVVVFSCRKNQTGNKREHYIQPIIVVHSLVQPPSFDECAIRDLLTQLTTGRRPKSIRNVIMTFDTAGKEMQKSKGEIIEDKETRNSMFDKLEQELYKLQPLNINKEVTFRY
jgi:hypothetical protein